MSASTEIRTVAVVGTGVIGASYVALFLAKGLKVIVSPTKENGAANLEAAVAKAWPVLEQFGLAEGASQTNLEFVDDVFKHLDKVDLIQENGPESLEYKTTTFAALDAAAPPHVPIISTSSGFPSSKFISECKRNPGRVLIAHPFNPPHLIPAVEIVPHPGTEADITDRVISFLRQIGQRPIRVNVETPGFVLNRIQTAMLYEAQSLVNRGVISPGDLDDAVTGGIGLRLSLRGPFMSMSLSGGGGPEGYARLLQHIGPAAEFWLQDMDKHRLKLTKEIEEGLTGKVAEMFENLPTSVEERLRVTDETYKDIVELKKLRGLP
ncbi:hypothetical protein BX600DRAFT_461055 [Xylariales sp. PMI_506]|nr:hypothetical protein BX600DRAFT_461055 [Xylariales sp. PMI_506]